MQFVKKYLFLILALLSLCMSFICSENDNWLGALAFLMTTGSWCFTFLVERSWIESQELAAFYQELEDGTYNFRPKKKFKVIKGAKVD